MNPIVCAILAAGCAIAAPQWYKVGEARWIHGLAMWIASWFFSGLALFSPVPAHAAPIPESVVRAHMILVERALGVSGYAATVPPVAETTDALPWNKWGGWLNGRVLVNERMPTGCLSITLAHELTHDAQVKLRLIPADVSLMRVTEWADAQAEAVARAIDDGTTNCGLEPAVETLRSTMQ